MYQIYLYEQYLRTRVRESLDNSHYALLEMYARELRELKLSIEICFERNANANSETGQ